MEESVLNRRSASLRAWVLGAAAAAMLAGCSGADTASTRLVDLEQLQARVQAPRDRPLLLVFWATWCKPCVEEIPALAALQARHREDLEILAISLDVLLHDSAKSLELVAAQQRETPMPYENLIFVGKQDPLFEAFDLPGGIPYALLFDAQGRTLQRFNGAVDPQVVEKAIVTSTR